MMVYGCIEGGESHVPALIFPAGRQQFKASDTWGSNPTQEVEVLNPGGL